MATARFTRVDGHKGLFGAEARREAGELLAGFAELEGKPRPYIAGYLEAWTRKVPRVAAALSAADKRGWILARMGIRRMDYRVVPGLYCVGNPGKESPVLVTANYKLSFDALRKELGGLDAWIVVLDTKGINVWCAAGKGTFGTEELVRKVRALRLSELVSHSTLILPQLGAPGVAAPVVRRETGFRVAWGPVLAADIKEYLAAGMRKTERMGEVDFKLRDRIAVAPIELIRAWPAFLVALAAALALSLPFDGGAPARAARIFAALAGTLVVGTIGFPALLPFLPFKAFSLKGAVLGAAWGVIAAFAGGFGALAGSAVFLVSVPVVAFIAMNFTGSSTFTCQEGARLEVLWGTIPMALSLILGLGALIAEVFI
jgi:hypothetical protein